MGADAVKKLELFSTNPIELPKAMKLPYEKKYLDVFLNAGYLIKLHCIAGASKVVKYRRADPFSIATAFGSSQDELKEVQRHEGYVLEDILGAYFSKMGTVKTVALHFLINF